MPLHLKAFYWRSRGNALAYLPLMIEATKAGGAMLLRNKSVGRFALMMVPSLSAENKISVLHNKKF